MSTTRNFGFVKRIAAATVLAGALAAIPATVAPQLALADTPGHSTRDDSHPGNGSYNDSHDLPSDPSNRSEPAHAIPAERSYTYDSDEGGRLDICAYKPYYYAC